MSYLQIYTIDKEGDMYEDKEFRNSHGFATQVWDAIYKRYKRILFPNDPVASPVFRDMMEETDAVFDHWKELPLKAWEARVLMFAYDNALLHREAFKDMAESLRRFEDAHWTPGNVSHCTGLADRLDELLEDEDVQGVGLYLTSVAECSWSYVYSEDEDGDEDEDDEGRPFNINIDSGYWWIDEHEKWNV